MKLVHCNLSHQIVLEEYGITQWIIENPNLFGLYVQELYRQAEGAEGQFVLSNADKELNIMKKMEMIMNPLLLDMNHRKILNKLYGELAKTAYAEDIFLETQKVLNNLQQYFFRLEQGCEYMLEANQEIAITELFKTMKIQMLKTSEDFFVNCIQYLKIAAGLLEKAVVVIVNATAYFNSIQIKQLHEMAVYEELRVLFIESEKKELELNLPQYIIDIDMCEI